MMSERSVHSAGGPRGRPGWNEIQFLEADQLRRMAPSILGLEISRLTEVCERSEPGSEVYNAAVKARFEIRRFLESLPDAANGLPHLEAALICLAWTRATEGIDAADTLRYSADRIAHVVERIRLLY